MFPFWGNLFPSTDYNRVNLDWIFEKLKSVQGAIDDSAAAREDAAEAKETAEEAKEIAQQAASGVIGNGAVTWVKLNAEVQQRITGAEDDIDALETLTTQQGGRITTAENDIDNLETLTTQQGQTIITQGQQITDNDGRITQQGQQINTQGQQIAAQGDRISALEAAIGGGTAPTTEFVVITSSTREDGMTTSCNCAYRLKNGMVEVYFDFYPKNTSGSGAVKLFTLPEGMRPAKMIWQQVWVFDTNNSNANNHYILIMPYDDGANPGEFRYNSAKAGEYNRFVGYVCFPPEDTANP